MVSEHLPMVLTTLFNMDNNELLQPECPLDQQVALHETTELAVGPAGPELRHIQPVRRIVVDVLFSMSAVRSRCSRFTFED